MRRDLVRNSVLASALFVATFFAPGAWAETGVRHKHGKPPVEGVLNLNRASEAEMRLLPGIGKGRAKTIVARREGKPFASLEDVARIKGMRRIVQRLHAISRSRARRRCVRLRSPRPGRRRMFTRAPIGPHPATRPCRRRGS